MYIAAKTLLRARELRRNMTDAEKLLWPKLREMRTFGFVFRRQHPVEPYVLDFACVKAHLCIELDGGQHADNPRDKQRDAFLEARGWSVLRFWNNEVHENMEGLLEKTLAALKQQTTLTPTLAHAVGEGV